MRRYFVIYEDIFINIFEDDIWVSGLGISSYKKIREKLVEHHPAKHRLKERVGVAFQSLTPQVLLYVNSFSIKV